MKVSGNIDEDVELYQKILCASRSSKGCVYNILGTAKGIKLKLSENDEGNGD